MTAIPDPPPVSTTALDWADRARRDGWRLSGGVWRHDHRDDEYDNAEWVYLGDFVWEDAHIASLAPDERREALVTYLGLRWPDEHR